MTIKQGFPPALYFVYPFVGLVVWQVLANYYGVLKPSLCLEVVHEFCSSFLYWLGYQVGCFFNVYKWLSVLKDWLIILTYWFGPIIDATQEIVLPLVNILSSLESFFVGFSKNNVFVLSVSGVFITIRGVFWCFQGVLFRHFSSRVNASVELGFLYSLIFILIGVIKTYPIDKEGTMLCVLLSFLISVVVIDMIRKMH
jgi:hypothetical protein